MRIESDIFGEREIFKRISGRNRQTAVPPVAVACAETHATAHRAEAGGSLPLTRKMLYAVMTVPVLPSIPAAAQLAT